MHVTDREREILERVARGDKYSLIASDLGISIDTVDFHLRNLRRKAGAKNTLAVAVFFVGKPTEFLS